MCVGTSMSPMLAPALFQHPNSVTSIAVSPWPADSPSAAHFTSVSCCSPPWSPSSHSSRTVHLHFCIVHLVRSSIQRASWPCHYPIWFLLGTWVHCWTRWPGWLHPQQTRRRDLGYCSSCSVAARTSCVISSNQAGVTVSNLVPLTALSFCELSIAIAKGAAHSISLSKASSKAYRRDFW